jgi:glycosyltransferase involved in cell wall biosynthesis
VKVSVVVRTRDEAPRLRLTLASLSRQSAPCEVVVVDDGSADATPAVIDEARGSPALRTVRHATARGRSAASNAGARAASGDVLVFLDGDTLAHPGMVARHMALHEAEPAAMGRGLTLHLRGTRFLADPETGEARAGEENRVARWKPDEAAAARVTRQQVLHDFAAIERRAGEGVYPGAGARLLQDLEMQALRETPDLPVLWAAACGSNFSVPRAAFLQSGGFDARLDINEHRELALRLSRAGLRLRPVSEARSYHLTHRSGWRDPLVETAWEQTFFAAHPERAVALLAVFWASLAPGCPLSPGERTGSLAALDAAARGDADIAALRDTLGLQPLPLPQAALAAS